MIGVKEAVKAAIEFVRRMYQDTGVALEDLALEEVKKSDDRNDWVVTVGFRALSAHQSARGPGLFPIQPVLERVPRDYKEVVIDGQTGEPKAMVIRDI